MYWHPYNSSVRLREFGIPESSLENLTLICNLQILNLGIQLEKPDIKLEYTVRDSKSLESSLENLT